MSVSGLKLAILFAFKPSELRYCGTPFNLEKVVSLTRKTRWSYDERESVKKWLRGFEAFFPYLYAIADTTGFDWTSKKVVSAYVIGNELWEEGISAGVIERIQEMFKKYAVTEQQKGRIGMLDRLKELNPPITHNFHVLYFGSVTGRMDVTVPNQDMCKVSLGRVKEVLENEVIVEYNKLVYDGGWKTSTAELEANSPFFIVGRNEYVLIHWKTIFWKPTQRQVENYRKYFSRLLYSMNSLNL